MVLRKGLFWFYLEHRDIRPIVKEEKKPPCSRLYVPDKKNLLFQVSYYEKRINFEVFHALTDGTGAMHFLQELVINYLKKAHRNKICHLCQSRIQAPPVIKRRIAFPSIIPRIFPEILRKNLALSDFRENGCFMRICILQRLYFR